MVYFPKSGGMTSLPFAPLRLPTRPPEVLHPRFHFSHLQAPQTDFLHSQDLPNISCSHVVLSPVHVSLGHMCHFFQEAELGVTSESHLPHPLALCGSARFLAYVAVSYIHVFPAPSTAGSLRAGPVSFVVSVPAQALQGLLKEGVMEAGLGWAF